MIESIEAKKSLALRKPALPYAADGCFDSASHRSTLQGGGLMHREYEIGIVGGGIAGLAAAEMYARSGRP